MKLFINGQEVTVPRQYEVKLMEDIYKEGEGEYQKLENTWRVLAKPFSRGILLAIEKEVARTQGKEAAMAIRPPHGEDANLWLGKIIAGVLLEGLRHVELSIDYTIDERGASATAFSVAVEQGTSATGGLVDSDGGARVRQINGPQIP